MPRGEGKGAPLPPLKRDTMIVIAFSFFFSFSLSLSLSLPRSRKYVQVRTRRMYMYACMYPVQCPPFSLFFLSCKASF